MRSIGAWWAISLAATTLTALCLVGIFARKADDPRELASWARAHGVALDDRTRPVLAYFVRLTILLRVIGGVGGLFLGSLFDDALATDTSAGFGFWVWVLAGWMAGAAWAERHLPRPRSGTPVASLTPRRLADYLPLGLRMAPAAGAVATVAVIGAGLAVRPEARSVALPLVLLALGAGAAAALVAGAQRSVVDRRQAVAHPDLVAADDAIRASTVHHLGGGGAALTLLLAAQALSSVVTAGDDATASPGAVPLLLMLVALGIWRFWSHRAWRVRRPVPRAVAVGR